MLSRLRALLRNLIWTSVIAAAAGALSLVAAVTAPDRPALAIAFGLYGIIFALLTPSE